MNTQPFDQVVRQICAMREDPRAKSYVAVAIAAKIAMDQLNMFAIKDFFKSIEVTVSDNLTIDFPSDFLVFSKLGTPTDKGIKVLGYNPKAVLQHFTTDVTCDCDEVEEEDTTTRCELCTFRGFHNGNAFLGEYYGFRVPQNQEGSFRIDYDNRQIVLSSGSDVFADATLILEYKPEVGADQLMRIPKPAFLMIMHKTNEIMDQYSRPQAAQAHAMQFKKEYDAYKRLMDETTPLDIIKSLRGEYTSSPRG